MAYRNGTYVAFHANGTSVPTESDIKYYNIMKAWLGKNDDNFTMINSHDKTGAVRDSSKKETLRRSLRERLNSSKNMILLIGETTKDDDDWVPYEIEYAIDTCKIPLIVAYIDVPLVTYPRFLTDKWPLALKKRIESGTAKAVHIPFKKDILNSAIERYHLGNLPKSGVDTM